MFFKPEYVSVVIQNHPSYHLSLDGGSCGWFAGVGPETRGQTGYLGP